MRQEQPRIRDETSQKQMEAPADLSDILLVMDQKQATLRAASDEEGKTVPVDGKDGNQPFLKIDKGSILENFISNYLRQAKDPTDFRFFRVPVKAAKTAVRLFRELLKKAPSKEALDFARKYEVKPGNIIHQKLSTKRSVLMERSVIIKNQKSDMENHQSSIENQKSENTPSYRFNEAMIDWKSLDNFGISKQYLQDKGLLDEMLYGRKSSKLVPITANFSTVALKADARLSFQNHDGKVVLGIHGVRKEPELDRPYYGHTFTEDEKRNLKETGNMGRLAYLLPPGGSEKVPYFISLDRLTNEITTARADKVRIREEICGVKLSEQQISDLKEGKGIQVDGMINPKTGKEFSATLQVNAEKYQVEFIFPNNGRFNKETIAGAELSKAQLDDLHNGKTVFVEDMKRKTGELFSSFVNMDSTGKLQFHRKNPETGEIYIPKEISNLNLHPDDRQALREGKTVFLEGMINAKGEEFDSYVKAHPDTGQIQYARTEFGFNERPAPKIPDTFYGHKFTATERGQLQDGKALHVNDMQGFDGKAFAMYVKVNQNTGKLDTYSQNPDKPKESAKQANTSQADGQVEKQQKTEKQAKPAKSRKIS